MRPVGLTLAQHERRAQGIGASDVAAIAGLNPFRTATDVWMAKRRGPELERAPILGEQPDADTAAWHAERIARERGEDGANTWRIDARTLGQMLELQGLPKDALDECPLTLAGKRKMVGNAVPLPMARAVAKAVRRALEAQP